MIPWPDRKHSTPKYELLTADFGIADLVSSCTAWINTVNTVADNTGSVYIHGGICCYCSYSGFVLTEKPVQDASLVVHGQKLVGNKIDALMHKTKCVHAVNRLHYMLMISIWKMKPTDLSPAPPVTSLLSWRSKGRKLYTKTTGIINSFLCDRGNPALFKQEYKYKKHFFAFFFFSNR